MQAPDEECIKALNLTPMECQLWHTPIAQLQKPDRAILFALSDRVQGHYDTRRETEAAMAKEKAQIAKEQAKRTAAAEPKPETHADKFPSQRNKDTH